MPEKKCIAPDEYVSWDYLRCPPSREMRAAARDDYIPRQKDAATVKLSHNLYGYQPKLQTEQIKIHDPITAKIKTVNVSSLAPARDMPNLYPVQPPPAEHSASRVVPRRHFLEIGPAESVMRYLDQSVAYRMHPQYRNQSPRGTQDHIGGFYTNETMFNPKCTRVAEGHPTIRKHGFRTLDINRMAKCANGRNPRSNPPSLVPVPPTKPKHPIDAFTSVGTSQGTSENLTLSRTQKSQSQSQGTLRADQAPDLTATYLPQKDKSLPPVRPHRSPGQKQQQQRRRQSSQKEAKRTADTSGKVHLEIHVFEQRLQRMAEREGHTVELSPPDTPDLEQPLTECAVATQQAAA
mmetsp:Transcript_142172/g.247830  ORF Transcript_142172/g.247830 Transcript_142172/m.247830 type:complete len:349 (-) Transcript_142172:1021-2067(-)